MNVLTTNSPVSFGVVAGILVALWDVLVKNGLLDGLSNDGAQAVTALVLLVIPVVAAFVAQRFTTPIESPTLEIGTVVNERSSLPAATVVADTDPRAGL